MSTIVIYDSGVGGLSILQQVRQRCPQFRYVFVSDNAEFPYGVKSESALIERTQEVSRAIQHRYAPDMMIVACNSASTIALPSLRAQFAFPIVGVVPAIKPAAILSHSKCIGILATPGTIARSYTQDLIEEHAKDCEIVKVGSLALVEMAEAKLRGAEIEIAELANILLPFSESANLDVLVLACTHFPLLRDEMQQVLGSQIQLLDSAAAIAKRVEELSKDFSASSVSSLAVQTKASAEPAYRAMLSEHGLRRFETLEITTPGLNTR